MTKAENILEKIAISPEYVAKRLSRAASTIGRNLQRAPNKTKHTQVLSKAKEKIKGFNKLVDEVHGEGFRKRVQALAYSKRGHETRIHHGLEREVGPYGALKPTIKLISAQEAAILRNKFR